MNTNVHRSCVALSSLATLAASLFTLTAWTPDAHAQSACSNRTKVMLCGSTNRPLNQTFLNPSDFTLVPNSCTPDADTKALLISRNGVANVDGPTLLAYLNAGGVVITEWNIADDVYNSIYGTAFVQGEFIRGAGFCKDNPMPSLKLNTNDPFWVANSGLNETAQVDEGCGHNLIAITDADPLAIPLGSWASDPGKVSYARRPQGAGVFQILEADWQDNERAFGPDSLGFMRALIDDCSACTSDADCTGTDVCDLAGSNTCEPVNTCGNGTVEAGESCDDGDVVAGDGCSATCLIENDGPCTDDADCASGACDSNANICVCDGNEDCAMGFVCDTAQSTNSCEPAINFTSTIATPADGEALNTSTVIISGAAEPNTTVEVSIDGMVAGTVMTDILGMWVYTAMNVSEGAHTTSIVVDDGLGNTASVGPVAFSVDTIAPAPDIVAPADGAFVNNSDVEIKGTTEPNAVVDVSVDGMSVGTVTADARGDWSITAVGVTEGAHAITVVSTDDAGNSGVAGPSSFTLDTTAPALTLDTPTNGDALNTLSTVISGTSEPGVMVTITIDGVIVDTVMTDMMGNWTYSSAILPEGVRVVSVSTQDAAGNTADAGPVSFVIDFTAPTPVITSPADGALVGTTTPTLSGTSEPNSTVEISVDGTVVDTVIADGQGNWSIPSAPLAEGVHTVNVLSTDAAGNSGDTSSTFTVDVTAPTVSVTAPVNGAALSTLTPVISGTAEPGAVVAIEVDGVVLDTVTADAQGDWTYTSGALAEGQHTLVVSASDATGNNTELAPTTFTLDVTAPVIVVLQPIDGTFTSDTQPEINGTSEPNSMLTLVIKDAQGDVVETLTTTADNAGMWTAQGSVPLTNGSHTVEINATDAAGNSTDVTSGFTVDTTVRPIDITTPDEPFISTARPDISGTTDPNVDVTVVVTNDEGVEIEAITVASDAQGNWTAMLAQDLTDDTYNAVATVANQAGVESSDQVQFTVDTVGSVVSLDAPVDGSTVTTVRPTVSGTGEDGDTVTVTITDANGATQEFTTTVDAQGAWSITPDADLPEGTLSAVATATDAAGNETSTDAVTFDVDVSTPALTIDAPVDASVATTARPTISGTAEPGATIDVSTDAGLLGSTTADDQGNWSIALDEDLEDGEYTISATATDSAGNQSPEVSITFTVDTTAPDVAITSPTTGQTVGELPLVISGTAEPGASVEVTLNGVVVDTVTADAQGNWSVAVTDVAEGDATVEATATDSNGLSQTTDPITFTVELPDTNDGQAVVQGGGCGCSSSNGSTPDGSLLVLLGVVGFGMIRRRKSA